MLNNSYLLGAIELIDMITQNTIVIIKELLCDAMMNIIQHIRLHSYCLNHPMEKNDQIIILLTKLMFCLCGLRSHQKQSQTL